MQKQCKFLKCIVGTKSHTIPLSIKYIDVKEIYPLILPLALHNHNHLKDTLSIIAFVQEKEQTFSIYQITLK